MEELNLVLDTIIRTFNLFMPFLEDLHLLEIGLGVLFALCGLRLLVPLFGTGLRPLVDKRGK